MSLAGKKNLEPFNQFEAEGKEKVISLKNVGLKYKTKRGYISTLSNISLDIEKGEFISLLGPSGCGKSTLLNIIAGFLTPTTGAALMNGQLITGADWRRGVVFQQPALYPWLNVEKNVQFGPKMRKVSSQERNSQTEYYLKKVGLFEFRKHKPYELSGGMKQRIALARALVNDPQVLLMDEPFAALDALTREQMQNLLRGIWKETGKTILFITHDVDEALSLGTRVIIMSSRPGQIIKEFQPSFTRTIIAENSNHARFSEEFGHLREQVLTLINTAPSVSNS